MALTVNGTAVTSASYNGSAINELRFNGTTVWLNPSVQDYIIENGQLLWANPNIYLQSTGTEYINTGVSPSSNIEFDVKFLTNNSFGSTDYGCIFGGRKNSGDNDLQVTTFSPSSSQNGTFRFGVNTKDSSQRAGITLNKAMVVHFHNLNYSSETVNYKVSSYNFSRPKNIFLFGLNNNGSMTQAGAGCRIYFAKFTKGTTKYHFVPVSQGLVIGSYTVPSNGMWDIVSQQFYGNAGSGSFTYGKDN